MKIVIIGNGILGLMTGYKLLRKDASINITLIGPDNQKGSASLAAAAMFNSFAEIDGHTLQNETELQKFIFNKSSTRLWPSLLLEIEEDSQQKINYGFGTYIINNHASDSLEDENFDAIIESLKQFNEEYESISPSSIPNYKPSASGRAGRAIFINNEGWVNPIQLLGALKRILQTSQRVKFIDSYCKLVYQAEGEVKYAEIENGEKVFGEKFILTPGATFSKIIGASNLEIKFPKIFYGVGCSILLKTYDETLSNCIRTPNRGLACGIYSAPHDKSHTLIGASNLISPEPIDDARVTSVYTLLKSAMEQINTEYFKSELVKVNIGWRPTSEDTLPLIGKTSIYNLIVATGTKRDGLHCSPVISDFLSDLILQRPSSHNLDLYNPERRPVKMYTREDAISIAVRHSINAAYQHDFIPAKNRMISELETYYKNEFNALHDKVGAFDWGIPPEMINMYKYGHINS